ncbi:mCG1040423 [Mus musculus]|nr:mCG1040423 [Mus musculus]
MCANLCNPFKEHLLNCAFLEVKKILTVTQEENITLRTQVTSFHLSPTCLLVKLIGLLSVLL